MNTGLVRQEIEAVAANGREERPEALVEIRGGLAEPELPRNRDLMVGNRIPEKQFGWRLRLPGEERSSGAWTPKRLGREG